MRTLLALLLLPLPAFAQVDTNNKALDSLGPATAQTTPAAPHAAAASQRHRRSTRRPAPAHPAQPPLRAIPIPAAPPPNAVISPPPFIMPAHKPPPPPPVPVKADALGTVTPIEGATRISFGPGSSDLNPTTQAALLKIAADAKADPLMQINVTAWAPGTTEDPSTPRRLSLDRALAARAVLINAGIGSERIHAIAKGFNDIGTAPPDRVDVAELLPPAKATTPPGTPAPPAKP